jgi:hypothetical protein
MMTDYERKKAISKSRKGRQKEKYLKKTMLILSGFWIISKISVITVDVDFFTTMNNENITTNLTCQRVNNEYTHTLDNIVAYCKRCNCSCK